MSRRELKTKAKELLKGNVWKVFGFIFVAALIAEVIANLPTWLGFETTKEVSKTMFGTAITVTKSTTFGSCWTFICYIIGLTLNVAVCNYLLKFIRNENPTFKDSFMILKDKAAVIIPLQILVVLFIALGYICLIIPGIILTFALVLCNFIVVDEDLKPMEIIKKSCEMMKGHKFDYFVLGLSFIGWALLCVFIIPMIYVIPYVDVTFALFYENLKNANKEM